MSLSDLSLAVVGAQFPNKRGPTRLFEVALCRPGDPVQLVPEPKNPKDPRAIMVVSERGVQMGYVTAERAPLIGRQIADGADVRAIFQAATKGGAVIRVAFDGNDPDLPPEREPEPDFYPDYAPPDD